MIPFSSIALLDSLIPLSDFPMWVSILMYLLGGIASFFGLKYLLQVSFRYLVCLKLKDYYPPDMVRAALSRDPHRWGVRGDNSYISIYSFFKDLPPAENPAYYLLLGPTGMGKSYFFIHLYAAFLLKKGLFLGRTHLISLNGDTALEKIQATPNKHKCILLLDGLDEDSLLNRQFEKRMDALLAAVEGFGLVIMTGENSHFPNIKPGDMAHSYVGEQHMQKFIPIELLPLDEWQVQKELRKNMSVKQAEKVWSFIEDKPEFRLRPLWLKPFAHWKGPDIQPYIFQIYSAWVSAELSKITKEAQQEGKMLRFLEALAGMIGAQKREGKALSLKADHWKPLAQAFDLDPKLLEPVFLISDSEESCRFKHIGLLSYFLALSAYREGLHAHVTNFEGLDLARTFYLEMSWLRYRESCVGAPSWYRTNLRTDKHLVSQLNSEKLPEVRWLYLSEYRNMDLRFLRMMNQLAGIYLQLGRKEDLGPELLGELPPSVQYIMLGWEDEEQILMVRETDDQHKDQSEDNPSTQSFKEWLLPSKLQKDIPLAPSDMDKVESGHKHVLSLFHHNLLELDPTLFQSKGTFINAPGLAVQHYFSHLSDLEFELFNTMEVFKFDEHSFNIRMGHSYRPTLFEEMIRDMVNQLYDSYGEDDHHLTTFSTDDLAMIREGIWPGRIWSWQNSDSYAFPLALFMAHKGQLTLVLKGLGAPGTARDESGFSSENPYLRTQA